MLKRCNKCGLEKEFSFFGNDKRNSDGKQGICNLCKDADKRRRREERVQTGNYVVAENKECNKCNKNKPLPEFFADKAMRDRHSSICKECKRESVYKWREQNKDRYNDSQRAYMKTIPAEKRYGSEIKHRYGCTLEQYNAMLTAQGGACAICSTLHNPAEKKGRLYVDHCHKTKAIRALLCGACNSMLGYAKDETRILLEAAAYIGRYKV